MLDIARNTNLINENLDFSSLTDEVSRNIFHSENWLLIYESLKKGWITPENENTFEENQFFKILKDLDIEFYDGDRQLKVYPPVETVNYFTDEENSIYNGGIPQQAGNKGSNKSKREESYRGFPMVSNIIFSDSFDFWEAVKCDLLEVHSSSFLTFYKPEAGNKA